MQHAYATHAELIPVAILWYSRAIITISFESQKGLKAKQHATNIE